MNELEQEHDVDLKKFKITPDLIELINARDLVTAKRNELIDAKSKFINLLRGFEK